ncbi:rhodanese-like domain-containing protein [Agromyces soli]
MTAADLATTPIAAPSGTIFAHVADQAAAIAHFSARLAFETDVSDVAAGLREQPGAFVVVDTRSEESWAQGHVPGATHLPTRRIAAEASGLIAPGSPVVVYCWGPGCNGAQRAALEFARLGHPVKEMIGGFEYWVREGFAYETADGLEQRPIDALTNVAAHGLGGAAAGAAAISCAC